MTDSALTAAQAILVGSRDQLSVHHAVTALARIREAETELRTVLLQLRADRTKPATAFHAQAALDALVGDGT